MDFTPIARRFLVRKAKRTDCWRKTYPKIQISLLKSLLQRASGTRQGERYAYSELAAMSNPYKVFTERVEPVQYEDIRQDVMKMIAGEKDVLWPGVCRDYAQSSGTSGGKSKYIPVTRDSLRNCHYRGAADCVAHYLRCNPDSRIFSGKAFVLGGSFANELNLANPHVRVGDLSATLINRMNPLANMFRIPDKHTALLPDWEQKLPALVNAARMADVTNISGVPSWFLTVIKSIMEQRGVDKISDVWPNLEVFFHGGISFEPYREIYSRITDPAKMHFMETYNASEGFFAVQNDPFDSSMLLIMDNDVFYEFIPLGGSVGDAVCAADVEAGKIYELMITSSNGLWRYRLGDTVRVVTKGPLKIKIAGRTKTFINAFGEELMEENAEKAIATACRKTNAEIINYTAAPVFATNNRRGRHQWIVEWSRRPADVLTFAAVLDHCLRELNSDYDAKRSHTIFLDPPEIISVPAGTFDKWLVSVGSRKLGGQRKVPRLSNNRDIADSILSQLGNL
ncbi:MAG: GH3 auxin-responsive promoter family protein [Candidatus Amulumruptor caecigallinarius]|nr:GH3 auxin-responsive promoter family protein [Candidatus Amulumruptor caecigallinarius]